jgi:hypothetical protein
MTVMPSIVIQKTAIINQSTILGIQENQLTINDRERHRKGPNQVLNKLMRAKTPLFSGGLTNEGIQELNQLIENELSKPVSQPCFLDLKLEPDDDLIANFSPRKIKYLDERARELYHSLGSSCLHKMAEFFSLKKD